MFLTIMNVNLFIEVKHFCRVLRSENQSSRDEDDDAVKIENKSCGHGYYKLKIGGDRWLPKIALYVISFSMWDIIKYIKITRLHANECSTAVLKTILAVTTDVRGGD